MDSGIVICPDCGNEDFEYDVIKGKTRRAWCPVCGHHLTENELKIAHPKQAEDDGTETLDGAEDKVLSDAGDIGSRFRNAIRRAFGRDEAA